MLRQCNGKDPHLVKEDGKTPCDCGAIFDDVYWMVVFPHKQVHGDMQLRPDSLDPRKRKR